ncbi:DUF427 domain-containing protein [Arthrobacter burdickii]|uniref:hypothetical protein n=1 Tax=Arthrobacter burdickii TaxID=3035920 RepID=UPI00342F4432
MLPVRYYFRTDGVEVPLVPSPTRTVCPCKGRAWTYAEPFGDASALAGYLCFFYERLDLVLDWSRRPRPVPPLPNALAGQSPSVPNRSLGVTPPPLAPAIPGNSPSRKRYKSEYLLLVFTRVGRLYARGSLAPTTGRSRGRSNLHTLKW